jgi:hypothetical protein
MYDGECDWRAYDAVAAVAKMPLVRNGDLPLAQGPAQGRRTMVGRAFVRGLGAREDVCELLGRYVDASAAELCGDRAVLGRMKELVAYWRELPRWRRLWPSVKIARTVEEFCLAAGVGQNS